MNQFINAVNKSVSAFVQDEKGSQVIEYALIIAVISVGLVAALAGGTNTIKSAFTALVTRVNTCFTATCV
jgi:pilus assembly protein Flp/PilA